MKRPSTPPHPKGSVPEPFYKRHASKQEMDMLHQKGANCSVENLKRRKAYLDCEKRYGDESCDALWAPHIEKETCRISIGKRRKKTRSARKKQ